MTTATCCDHITREQALSEQEAVRLNIMRLVNEVTNNGATLVQKYQDFINGEYPDAKPYIIHAAMRDLSVMGGHLPEDTPGSAARVVPAPDANAVAESKPKPKKPKITMKELANWDMGRLIRSQSNNGRNLILELWDMMNPRYVYPSSNPDERKYQKATEIKSHHEFRAMQEIVKRGHGCQNPYAYVQTSAMEERRLQEWLARETREIDNDGLDVNTYLFEVIRNPKENRWGEIITKPYTQSQRLWSLKHLLWRGIDIPWEHITPADIEKYYRELGEQKRIEAERRLEAERRIADPNSTAPLTPEQESAVLGMLEHMQRAADESDAKAAKKAEKKAKKAAKRAAAAKSDAHDYNSAANRNSATNGKDAAADADSASDNKSVANAKNAADDGNNGNSAANNAANGNSAGNGNSANNNAANGNSAASADKDNGNSAVASGNNNAANTDKDSGNNAAIDTRDTAPAPTGAFATSLHDPDDRGAQAVANAIARHPNVDLDTALENHYATAGIPKENLSYGQIYDAIIAEANFQKRQANFKHLSTFDDPADGAEDNAPPKSRSP